VSSPRVAIERGAPHLTGVAVVGAVELLTPRLARITFEGPELAGFPDEEPGEIITLIWPADGRDEVVLPGAGWRYPPGAPDQHWRNYTIRDYDRERPAMVVDFVLHGDHGRASAWAARARAGDRVGFAGPRVHYTTDADAPWTLLAGDETALPSIAATLERMPDGHRVFALVEIDHRDDRQEIETRAEATIVWIERKRPPHASRALERAVRALALPDGPGKVWVAGESAMVRGLREHLRGERGVPIGPMQAIGYWKHRETRDDVDDDLE
jgi:NADPH-dependent ferric siderophore reductase